MQEFDMPQPEPRIYEIPDYSLESKARAVLVLEDDAAFAGTLKDALQSFGYQVTVAPTGVEGVQQVLAADFDAIVCDMVMPNFPGDMFYLAVQRSRPHLCPRFIFVTGHQDNLKVVEFIKQSGCLVIWKPFDMRRLLDALEFVTSGKEQPVPAATAKRLPKMDPTESGDASMPNGGANPLPLN